MDIVADLASNLKVLRIFHPPSHPQRRPILKIPWQGFQIDERGQRRNRPSRGFLQSFYLEGGSFISWFRIINVSRLQFLDFSGTISHEELDLMVKDCHFASLRSLALCLENRENDKNYDIALIRFFSNLPVLKHLRCVNCLTRERLDAILNNLGQNLRVFHVTQHLKAGRKRPFYEHGNAVVERVQQSCPQLEYLHIEIFATSLNRTSNKYHLTGGILTEI
jgi:hypothetical protein